MEESPLMGEFPPPMGSVGRGSVGGPMRGTLAALALPLLLAGLACGVPQTVRS